MTTDYEQFYQSNRHGLGEPTKEFVDFFKQYTETSGSVLDIGCGQGRDALFIARLGHNVTAIDLSPTGIRQLKTDADAEGLNITTIVADVRSHEWTGQYNVVIIDRTLHMLTAAERPKVLADILAVTTKGTHVLIADERSNIAAFTSVFNQSEFSWTSTLARGGYLFMVRP